VPAPTLRQLTGVFFRIGNTTFGGGLPTMAALQREFVEQHHWLTPEDYALAFSLARITPGTNVIAFCAASGARILVTLLHEMQRRKVRYGLVTMCVGGGMGAAGIFENLN